MITNLPQKKHTEQLWTLLNDVDKDLITMEEASNKGFKYLSEEGFVDCKTNSSLVDIYIQMVTDNMNTLQWSRHTKNELEAIVAEAIGMGAGSIVTLNDIDEDGLVSDYAWLVGIFENYGYIDIYYLIPPINSDILLITGMTISDE